MRITLFAFLVFYTHAVSASCNQISTQIIKGDETSSFVSDPIGQTVHGDRFEYDVSVCQEFESPYNY